MKRNWYYNFTLVKTNKMLGQLVPTKKCTQLAKREDSLNQKMTFDGISMSVIRSYGGDSRGMGVKNNDSREVKLNGAVKVII